MAELDSLVAEGLVFFPEAAAYIEAAHARRATQAVARVHELGPIVQLEVRLQPLARRVCFKTACLLAQVLEYADTGLPFKGMPLVHLPTFESVLARVCFPCCSKAGPVALERVEQVEQSYVTQLSSRPMYTCTLGIVSYSSNMLCGAHWLGACLLASLHFQQSRCFRLHVAQAMPRIACTPDTPATCLAPGQCDQDKPRLAASQAHAHLAQPLPASQECTCLWLALARIHLWPAWQPQLHHCAPPLFARVPAPTAFCPPLALLT